MRYEEVSITQIGTLTVAIVLAQLLAGPTASNLVSYLWHLCKSRFDSYNYRKRYSNYLADVPPASQKQVLLLCHGRKHGFPVLTFGEDKELSLESYRLLTIDIDPSVEPHIVADLCDPDTLARLEPFSFDYVIFYNCSCHTSVLNRDEDLSTRIWRLLKADGELIFSNYAYLMKPQAGFEKVSGTVYLSFVREPVTYPYSRFLQLSLLETREPRLERGARFRKIELNPSQEEFILTPSPCQVEVVNEGDLLIENNSTTAVVTLLTTINQEITTFLATNSPPRKKPLLVVRRSKRKRTSESLSTRKKAFFVSEQG